MDPLSGDCNSPLIHFLFIVDIQMIHRFHLEGWTSMRTAGCVWPLTEGLDKSKWKRSTLDSSHDVESLSPKETRLCR